jgi:hypothetical protein
MPSVISYQWHEDNHRQGRSSGDSSGDPIADGVQAGPRRTATPAFTASSRTVSLYRTRTAPSRSARYTASDSVPSFHISSTVNPPGGQLK